MKLRQKFLGGYASWHDYSTSRHLCGSNPTILSMSEKLRSSPCPDMIVELLSGDLAESWTSVGLQIAKDSDLQDKVFLDALLDSLVLIQGHPEIYATVEAMCRSLHPLIGNRCDIDISFSDPALPFSIFVSCPLVDSQYRVERLAESIVHEALHLQLSLIEKAIPLIMDNGDNTLAYSPWKGERRTLQGLVHGIYVFGNLRTFWSDVVSQRPDSSEFGKARVSAIEAEMLDVTSLVTARNLTSSGQWLASSFLSPYVPKISDTSL